jgi:hypothetical protein
MLKIGDRVRFVNDALDGVITSIKGKIAGVTTADDFEIPVVVSELVKIDETKKTLPNEKLSAQPQTKYVKIHSGIHIAFERLTDSMLELKLHNSESDSIQFAFYHKNLNAYTLIQKGEIKFETNVGLGIFHLEDIHKWPVLSFQILYNYVETVSIKKPLVAELSLNTKSFHRSFGQSYFLGKQAYHFRLDNEITELDLEQLKGKDFAPMRRVDTIDITTKIGEEVDLHIEKLVDNYKELSPQYMLDLQLATALKTLDTAYVNGLKRVVLIHGVGNNFLKKKIQDMLKKHPIAASFNAADTLKYGGGATEVWIRD